MRWLGALVYRLLAPVLVLMIKGFFRRVEVRGADAIPAAPLVVAANHPNMLLDPLLVGLALLPRRLHFLAKAPLFRIPVVGTLFRLLGVLPVHRRQDGPVQDGQNQGMFSACVEALHAGGVIGIFPEGVSVGEPRLQPLKTGAARILLEAAADAPDQPMFLLPVGLNYTAPEVFRSDVLVLFGEPLDPREYLPRYREDERGAVRALTEALEASLRGLTRNLERVEDERVIARLERVYRDEVVPVGEDLEERFYLSRSIVDGYEYFRSRRPRRVAAVEDKLERYFAGLETFQLSGAHTRTGGEGYGLGGILLFLVRVVPPLVLATPVALHGFVMNVVPYNLTDPVARRGQPGPEELATRKLLWGSLLFGIFYAAQTAAVAAWFGLGWAALYFLTLPPTGFLALWWVERLRFFARHSRTFWVFVTRQRFRQKLVALRRELLADLEALAEEYLQARERDAAGGGLMGLFRQRWPAFPYPTSAVFVSHVCLGVGGALAALGTGLYLSPLDMPAFWLAAPAALAFLAAWALGPGMREEFVFDPGTRIMYRRVHTLGVPSDEPVFEAGQIRLVGTARVSDPEQGTLPGAFVVVVDQRGRWLALAHRTRLQVARDDRDAVAKALGVPGVEYRCGSDWTPFWGRVQPPPPPETARLKQPGVERE